MHVPIFFVLSGYLFKSRQYKRLFSGLNNNILLPYAATAVIIIIISWFAFHFPSIREIQGIGNGHYALLAAVYGVGTNTQLGGTNGIMVPAIGAIWFLLAMFVGNVIFNSILLLIKRWKHQMIGLYVISIILAIVGFVTARIVLLPWSINAALISQIFYTFGYMLRKYDIVENWKIWQLVLGIALWSASVWSGFFYLNVAYANNIFLAIVGACGASFVLIIVSKGLAAYIHHLGWLTLFGRESLIVMCVHVIDLDTANYKFNPNKPGIFQWQSVDDVFLMVVD
ncbi:acyltransferase family protein [Furfurilactobacillus cerevisiae]|uniref:acyltransferase family protein n=1 Tax=Furfurilactobacillus rossiae TaxID=231049 RepID=UPI003B984557